MFKTAKCFYICFQITIMKKAFFFLSILLISQTINCQLKFKDVATAQGVDVSYGVSTYGGGVSFKDFDNDGWDDISYSSTNGKSIYFFKNVNGNFSLITFNGIDNIRRTKQVIWVDYDNDGDNDLFVTSINNLNAFYENDGNMNFTDISASCGLFQVNLSTYGASFGDIDNDGDLDVFIANRDDITENQRNYLYQNENGVFIDITEGAGINMENELTFCAAFFDYNNDGDQDIYIANDKSSNKNRLYKNNGDGTFEDVSDISGAGVSIDAMSTTIGDYNNDGWFDIYITNSPNGNQLLRNNGDETFTDVSIQTGTEFNSIGWGAVFLDANNDANLDLYVSGLLDGSNADRLSAAYYHNNGDNTYTIPNNIGFENDNRKSYSNAIGDFNNDGFSDIIVLNDEENNFLWENETTTANNWLKIKLEGVASNKDGIGNRIEVFANGESQYRYTLCGEGYLGQNSSYEFFGLADATTIDYIKVTWNKTGMVETIENPAINNAIIIQEGNGVLNTSLAVLDVISIYPNPSSEGIYTVNLSGSSFPKTMIVIDVSGRIIMDKKVNSAKAILDLSKNASGIYFVKITSDKKQKVLKIIKS
jgi:hypothetical protein